MFAVIFCFYNIESQVLRGSIPSTSRFHMLRLSPIIENEPVAVASEQAPAHKAMNLDTSLV